MCWDSQLFNVKYNGHDRKEMEKCLTSCGALVNDTGQYLLNLVFKQCFPTSNIKHLKYIFIDC